MKLKGTLTAVGRLSGKLNGVSSINSISGTIQHSDTTPYYNGKYEVIPAAYEQSLETKGLKMTDDVIVTEIPYYETTNESGGYTVIIGG